MKRCTLGIVIISALAGQNAAAEGRKHHDVAHVINVEPVFQSIEHRVPKETCWKETVKIPARTDRRHSGTPAILGGIIGGALGHELGHGSDNKKIGTLVGSILGMSIASDIHRSHRSSNNRNSSRQHDRFEEVEHCEISYTSEFEQELKGYHVSYRYHGQEYSTFMHEHPGKKIRVAVNVSPIHG